MIRGVGATALGPIVTTIIQLVSVPIFLHFWGVRLYGEWLLLSAMPTYLSLSDFGFATAAGTEMTMDVIAGRPAAAEEAFQTAWLLTTGISLAVALAVIPALVFLPLNRWLNISVLSVGETAILLGILALYVLMGLQTAVTHSGLRCDGNYAAAVFWTSIWRLVEFGTATLIVVFHGKPIQVAVGFLAARTLGTLFLFVLLKTRSPWLHYGFRDASWACVRRLAIPSLALMAFPTGDALSLQGMILVIGSVLGPVPVVAFSTLRTLTRFILQVIVTIKHTVWQELSAAFATGNELLAKRLHRLACQAALWCSLLAAGGLAIAGPWIYSRWTRGTVAMDVGVFHCLLIVAIANSLWTTSSATMIASNMHQRVAALSLIANAAGVAAACALIPYTGLMGAAVPLLIVDISVGWYVITRALAMVHDRWVEFVPAMLQSPIAILSRRLQVSTNEGD
jgi:O-antigen/teichoic acid export membrane protein